MKRDHDPDRIYFYDNLRWLFVLLVVVQHSAVAYCGISWWPVAEPGLSMTALWAVSFCDASTMPMLFYIAGVFALPVLRRKGFGAFAAAKLKRLGLPWLVCVAVVCPIIPFVFFYARDGMMVTQGYWQSWLATNLSFFEFNFRLLQSSSEAVRGPVFCQYYMWFISLLLFLFLLLGLAHKAFSGWFEKDIGRAQPIRWGVVKTTLAVSMVGGGVILASVASITLMFHLSPQTKDPESWLMVFNVLQFQPARIFLYLACFGLGVLSWRNNWLGRGMFSGNIRAWLAPALVLYVAFMSFVYALFFGPPEMREIFGVGLFFSRNLLTIAMLGLFTALGKRYFNNSGKVARNLSANSYDIYLAHYALVIGFQLLLLAVPGLDLTLKFISVSLLAMACAWAAGNYLLRPKPIASVFAAGALVAGMSLFITP